MTQWILVESCPSEMDAAIIKGQLEAAGIPCQLRLNRMGDALLGAVGIQNGPTDIFVPEHMAQAARKIVTTKEIAQAIS